MRDGADAASGVLHHAFSGSDQPALLGESASAPTNGAAHPDKAASPNSRYAALNLSPSSKAVIGHVVKADGHVSVIRNGIAVTLKDGDALLKGDVIETGHDGSVGIVFRDGSVFRLGHDSHLALNEFHYGHGGPNHAVFSLTEGALSFISGEIAKTGDLDLSALGVTAKIVEVVGGEIVADNGQLTFSAFQSDHQHGSFVLDQNGETIATVSSDGGRFTVAQAGPPQPPNQPGDQANDLSVFNIIQSIQKIAKEMYSEWVETSATGPLGSSTPPGFAPLPKAGSGDIPGPPPVPELIFSGDGSGQISHDNPLLLEVDLPQGFAGVAISALEGNATGTIKLATFTDAMGVLSNFTALVNWGDGTATQSATVVSLGNDKFAVEGTHTYAEEGAYSVGVILFDHGLVFGTGSTALIADAPLSATANAINGTEGNSTGTIQVATFTDANANAPLSDFTATIDWGDGVTTQNATVVSLGGSKFAVQGTHTYAEEGGYAVNVNIHDEGGSNASTTATATVVDAPLSATATSIAAVEGIATKTLQLATFTDGNATAPLSDFTATVDWGDGSKPEAATVQSLGGGKFAVEGTHTYAEESTYAVNVNIFDEGGSTASTTTTATVTDAPLTVQGTPVSAAEGTPSGLVQVATFTDANPGDHTADFTATIDWGDNNTSSGTVSYDKVTGSYSVTGNHTYAEEGPYTATVNVKDDGGSTATTTSSVTVGDAPLSTGTVSVTNGIEGVAPASVLTATFTDANTNAPTSDFSGTIDWGDGTTSSFGSSAVSGTSGSYAVAASHQYAEEGTYAPTVIVKDVGGSVVQETGSAVVTDAPLSSGVVSVTQGTEGSAPSSLTATFTDANLNATTADFSGTIDWGDGTAQSTFDSSAVSGSGGSFTVTASHQYAEESSYVPTVIVKDDGGSVVQETGSAVVTDAPLTAGTVTVTGAVENGASGQLSATFSDANLVATASDFSGTIDWGDKTTTTFTGADVTGSNGAFTVTASHQYPEDITFKPVVTINDVGGSTVSETGTAPVADAPLTAGTVTLDGGAENFTRTTLTATFSDANLSSGPGDFSGTVDWGNGLTTRFTSADVSGNNGDFTVKVSHQYTEEGTFAPTINIDDKGGSTVFESGSVTIADAPLFADKVTVRDGVEGVFPTSLTASIFDGNQGGQASDISGKIDWGDGNSTAFTSADVNDNGNGEFAVNFSHQYAEDGTFTQTVTFNDVGGSSVTETGSIKILDAPILNNGVNDGLAVLNPVEGASTGPVTVAFFTDTNPNATVNDFTASINWGDGVTDTGQNVTVLNLGGGTFSVRGAHTYAEEGVKSVSVTLTDNGGASSTLSGQWTVADAPLAPAIGAGGTVFNATEFTSTGSVIVGEFTDADPNGVVGDYTATINWGDGTTTQNATILAIANSPGTFNVQGAHTYADEGTFNTTITVTDAGGATTSLSGLAIVADAPPKVTTPTITSNDFFGTTTVAQGDVLTASASGNPDDTITFQWFSSANGFTTPIQSSGAQYTVTAADIGNTIEVIATSTNDIAPTASVSATSAATTTVQEGTDHWLGANNLWTTSADWSLGVPLSDEKAFVDQSGTGAYTLSVQDSEQAGSLLVNNNNATLDVVIAGQNKGALTINGATTVDLGALNVEDGASMTVASMTVHGGSVGIFGGFLGVANPDAGGVLTINGALLVDGGQFFVQPKAIASPLGPVPGTVNAASIDAATGGTVNLGGIANVSGEIEAGGGKLIVGANATFAATNTITIDNHGTAEFQGGATAQFGNVNATFAGPGTLVLDHAEEARFNGSLKSPYTGTISGFNINDTIVLSDLPFAAGSGQLFWDSTNHKLQINNGLGQQVVLNLLGTFDVGFTGPINDFALAPDPTVQVNGTPATDLVWAGPSQFIWSVGPNAPITAGSGLQAVTLTVEDSSGNPISGLSVVPSLSGLGQLSGPTNLLTDNNGQVSFQYNPGTTAGEADFSALIDGNVNATTKAFVVAANASNATSSLSAQVTFGANGESATLTLSDQDIFGNARQNDTVTWTGQTNDTFTPPSGEKTDVNGVAITSLVPHTDATETVTASFGGISEQATVNFVPLHTWDNVNGGDWSVDADWIGGVPGSSDAATIGIPGTYTVTVSQSDNETVFGLGTIATTTLDIAGTLTLAGGGDSQLAGTLDLDGGTLKALNGGTIEINGALGGSGGQIVADGATATINGSLSGAQNIVVTGAGIAEVAHALGANDTISFNGAGLVALAVAPSAPINVNNFGAGDNLVLDNLAYAPGSTTLTWSENANQLGGTLTVAENGVTETFHLAFSSATTLATSDFHLKADPLGSTGTDIVVNSQLNYATAQVTLLAPSQFSGANSILHAFGINNDDVAFGSYALNKDFFYLNGHIGTFALPATDTANVIEGFNSDNIIAGSVVNPPGHSGTYPATFANPGFDPSTGFFDNYANTPLITNLIPPGFGNGVATAIDDRFFVTGDVFDGFQNPSPVQNGVPFIGFVGTPNGLDAQFHLKYVFTMFKAGMSPGSTTDDPSVINGGHLDSFGNKDVLNTTPTGINNNGIVVGNFSTNGDGVDHGQVGFVFNMNTDSFTWINGPDGLGTGDGRFNNATATYDFDINVTGVNDLGQVVGTYGQIVDGVPFAITHNFIYNINTNTYTDITLPNVSAPALDVDGINNQGLLVGTKAIFNAQGIEVSADVLVANPNPVDTIDNGGTLYLNEPSNDIINFAGGTGKAVIEDPTHFHGQIQNFTGIAADASLSDVIDVAGVAFGTTTPIVWATGLVELQPATNDIRLNFQNFTGAFSFADDGNGGTLIYALNTSSVTIQNAVGKPVSGVEGNSTGTIQVATFSDAYVKATAVDFAATINWGDGTTTQNASVVALAGGGFAVDGSHAYAEKGTYAVGVTINYQGTNVVASTSSTATVADAPLAAGTLTVGGATEGVTQSTLTATFSDGDLNAPTSDFSGTITWGDGSTSPFTSSAVSGSNGAFTVSATHQYTKTTVGAPSIQINDVDGASITETGTAPTIADAPLTGSSAASLVLGPGGNQLSNTTFSDANPGSHPNGSYSGVVNWGDGTSDQNASFSFNSGTGLWSVFDTHNYAQTGNYNLSIAVTDTGGSTTTITGTAKGFHATEFSSSGTLAFAQTGGFIIDNNGTVEVQLASFDANSAIVVEPNGFLIVDSGLGAPTQTTSMTGTAVNNLGTFQVGALNSSGILKLTDVAVTGSGSFVVKPGGTLNTFGTDSIANSITDNGVINDFGTLTLSNAVVNNGTYNIETNATLEFTGSFAQTTSTDLGAGQGTIHFASGATLKIDNPASFHAFVQLDLNSPTEIIDLGGLNSQIGDSFSTSISLGAYGPNSYSTTTLTVTDNTRGTSASVLLLGDYAPNAGVSFVVAADGHGGVNVHDPAAAPTTIAAGETLSVNSPWGAPVTFAADTGTLQLDTPGSFTGHIIGFTGTAPDAQHSDVVDVAGIDFNSAQFAETYDAASGKLTVSAGANSASLTFDNFNGAFKFASDGHGGTMVFDPPAAAPVGAQTTVVNAGENFVFAPGAGANTIHNFDLAHDTIELDHFANVQTTQQLQSAITSDSQGEATIALGHGDNIVLAGITAQQLGAAINTAVHLH